MDSGCSCSAFLIDKIALLERRICQLEDERVASIKKTDTPESTEMRPARRTRRADAIVSTSSVKVTLSAARLAKADSSLPHKSFSGGKTLVIGDSVIRKVRLHMPAKVICIPGARAPDIEANLRVLACDQTYGVKLDAPNTDTSFDSIVVHVGTNDTRTRQTEVTKSNIARLCDVARKMCRHRLILSGPLPDKGNDERYSRLLSLNRWLARYSSEQGFGFIDNWPSMWGRPGVLMRDGLHPTGLGASIMSKNIDRCFSQA